MSACGACGLQLPPEARFCSRCGAPASASAAPSSDPLIGQTVGAYRIVSLLAEGGMGRAYRAEQINLGRAVCLKVLLPHLLGEVAVVQRFEREARMVSGLRHPNIVQVMDFGRTPDNVIYIVMELVEGGTLRRVIDTEAPIGVERALGLLEQVASALEEAHGAGVIHRDLKPENVLLGRLRDGTEVAKVTDFGIARTLDQEPALRLTATGMVAGTPGYMAPEQISGGTIDGRVDVYAAGVCLFELLTGKPVFPASTVPELLQRHLLEQPPSPSAVSGMPLAPVVDQLVLKALAPKPARRYASALDFKRGIEAARLMLRSGRTSVAPATAPAAPAPTAAQASLDALRDLVPQQLVGYLSERPGTLTEKRTVTAVFAELETEPSSSAADAEEVNEALRQGLEGLAERAAKYEGGVERFPGGALMAVFGAPKAHQDDPERAVRCAFDLQALVADLNRTLTHPLRLRLGLDTGEVVAGGRTALTGEVVNLATALAAAAPPGTALMSAATRRLTARAVGSRPGPRVTVKGRKEPVESFQVAQLEAQAAAAAPLVGRDAEKKSIEGLLGAVKAGRSGGVLFLGDAGLGKTRLLEEVAALARAQGLTVAWGSAGRWGEPAPFELVKAALFSLCGGLPKDLADADAKLLGLLELGVEQPVVKRLQQLFGTASASATLVAEDAQRQLRAAVVRALLGAGAKKGLCLLLDAVHLADKASLELLEELMTRSRGVPMALFASARPGDSEALLPRLARRELRPLSTEDVLRLARAELQGAALPPAAEEMLAAKAAGNPFYARELVRVLIQERALELRGGTWTAMPTLSGVALPDSVGLLVQSRLDALSAGARLLLRTASVAGRVFPLELVMAAIDTPIDVQVALQECVNRGFLAAVPSPPGCWQFTQAMVHEQVSRSITRADRKNLHARLGEALERGAPSGGDHPAVLMARHFTRAEQPRKATKYLVLGAERLLARGASEEAAALAEQALQLALKDILKGSVNTEDGATFVLGLAAKAVAARALVAPEKAAALADEVLGRTPPHLALKERAELLRQKGATLLKLSRVGQAEAALNDAMGLLAGSDATETKAAVVAEVAAAREAKGELSEAAALLLKGFQDVATSGARDLVWRYLNQLGRLHLKLKQPAKAREFFESARAKARAANDPVGEAKAVANLAGTLSAQGDPGAALALFGQAQELAEKAGDRVGVARVHYNVGRLLASTGQRTEAAERLDTALRLSTEVGWREGIAAATQALESLKK